MNPFTRTFFELFGKYRNTESLTNELLDTKILVTGYDEIVITTVDQIIRNGSYGKTYYPSLRITAKGLISNSERPITHSLFFDDAETTTSESRGAAETALMKNEKLYEVDTQEIIAEFEKEFQASLARKPENPIHSGE
jgi:hypothetical protein